MIASLGDILAAIRVSLAERVLPTLPQASWEAGDVRSCLTLLTYAEDALMEGSDALRESNVALCDFFNELLSMQDVSFLTPELRRDIPHAIEMAHEAAALDLAALDAAANGLKALLSRLIAGATSRGMGKHDLRAIQRLRTCLVIVANQELRISRRAGEMPPF